MTHNGQLIFTKVLPVKREVDVFVAGGGPSGIAAAVAAARGGCSVFLAEGQTCLGGLGTCGLIPVFMQFGDGVNFLAAGIGKDVLDRLGTDVNDDIHDHVTVKPEAAKRVYDEMLQDYGVTFSLMTHLIAVEMEKDAPDRVSSVVLYAKSGIFAVKAKIYIDCTGDGDMAAMAGASFIKGDENGKMMAGTLCSTWTGIDWGSVTRAYSDQAPPKEPGM